MDGWVGKWVDGWMCGPMAGRLQQAGWQAEDKEALAAKPSEWSAPLRTRPGSWAQLKALNSILFRNQYGILAIKSISIFFYKASLYSKGHLCCLRPWPSSLVQLFKSSSAGTTVRHRKT